MAIATLNDPKYLGPFLSKNGAVAQTWLTWFNAIKGVANSAAALEAELAALKTIVDADHASIIVLQAQMAAVQTAIAAAEASIATLQNALTALTAVVATHTLEIAAMQAEIDSLLTYPTVWRTKTTTVSIGISYVDFDIDCDATAGALTITLPAAPVLGEFHVVSKFDLTLNKVTINGNGHNIDNAATCALLLPGWSVDLQWNGTFWKLH